MSYFEEKKDHTPELVIDFNQKMKGDDWFAGIDHIKNLQGVIKNYDAIISLIESIGNQISGRIPGQLNRTIAADYHSITNSVDILSAEWVIENINDRLSLIEPSITQRIPNSIKLDDNIIALIKSIYARIAKLKNEHNHGMYLLMEKNIHEDLKTLFTKLENLINPSLHTLSLMKGDVLSLKLELLECNDNSKQILKKIKSGLITEYNDAKQEEIVSKAHRKLNVFLIIFLMKVLIQKKKIKESSGLVLSPNSQEDLKKALNQCGMLLIKLIDQDLIEKDEAIKIEKDLLTLYKAILCQFKESLGSNRPNVSMLNNVVNTLLIIILDKKYHQSPLPNEILEIMSMLLIKVRLGHNDDNDYVKKLEKVLKILFTYRPCIVAAMLYYLYDKIKIDTSARKKLSAISYLASQNLAESTKFFFAPDSQEVATYRAESDNSELLKIDTAPTTEIQMIRLIYDALYQSFTTSKPLNEFLCLELITQSFGRFPLIQVTQINDLIVDMIQELPCNRRLNINSDHANQYNHRFFMIYHFWEAVAHDFNINSKKLALLPTGSFFSHGNFQHNNFYSRNIDREHDDVRCSLIDIKRKTIDYFLSPDNITLFSKFITFPSILQKITVFTNTKPYRIDNIARTIARHNIVCDLLDQGIKNLTNFIYTRLSKDLYHLYCECLINSITRIALLKNDVFEQCIAEFRELQRLQSIGIAPFQLLNKETDYLITGYLREVNNGCYAPKLIEYKVGLFYWHRPTDDYVEPASSDQSCNLKNT